MRERCLTIAMLHNNKSKVITTWFFSEVPIKKNLSFFVQFVAIPDIMSMDRAFFLEYWFESLQACFIICIDIKHVYLYTLMEWISCFDHPLKKYWILPVNCTICSIYHISLHGKVTAFQCWFVSQLLILML